MRPAHAVRRKKPVNLSIDETLLREARGLEINLSQKLEEALERAVQEEKKSRWLAENREAIEDYNNRIERHGAFSDGLRRF